MRIGKLRNSKLVTEYGKTFLQQYSSRASLEELWDITEQVYIAALDACDFKFAQELLNKIKAEFSDTSLRVLKLKGMQLEAQQQWSKADAVYSTILEKDPGNIQAMKRQISIRRSLGDTSSAIKLLNEFLKIFVADTDAWSELADLYLELNLYKNAAFCYEELILSSPQNYHLYTRYGEILYTIGGYESLKLARKNFAYSLELQDTSNLRALYGLVMSTIAISNTKQGKQDKENSEILDWAHDKLIKSYQNSGSKQHDIISSAFSTPKDVS